VHVDSPSPAATERAGRALGRLLRGGDLVLLSGELGAGKTRFVKGLAAGCGAAPAREVVSPTFLRLEEYGEEPRRLRHLDAYRMHGPGDLEDLGGGDLFGPGGFTVVEWPERVWEGLPPGGLLLRFEHRGPRARRISYEARDARGRELLRLLGAAAGKARRAGKGGR